MFCSTRGQPVRFPAAAVIQVASCALDDAGSGEAGGRSESGKSVTRAACFQPGRGDPMLGLLLECSLLAAATTAAPAAHATFVLTSADLHVDRPIAHSQVYSRMGCDGQNQSPELSWKVRPRAPKRLRSRCTIRTRADRERLVALARVQHPATVTSLPTGAGDPSKNLLPAGTSQGNTDFGTPGYGGPCPPPGTTHRYVVTVYALNDSLSIPANVTAAVVGFNIHGHTIGKATLTGSLQALKRRPQVQGDWERVSRALSNQVASLAERVT